MKKFVAALAVLSSVALLAAPAVADTLKLVSVTGPNGQIYPYNFSVNGSSSLVSLMCIDLNREVQVGEQWNVNIDSIPTDTSTTSTAYRETAYIFSQLGKSNYTNTEVQYAAWDILDSADASKSASFDSNAQSLVNLSVAAATNSSLIAGGFFNSFQVYVPTSNQAGWTNGIPQEFVGVAQVAQTPEPSSLVLIGSGLIGLAGTVRRKLGRV